jgi:site-specific DNA-cytosine methylase
MTPAAPSEEVEFLHFHLFCGSGGGALGFNRGHARVGATSARFRCIGGIDADPTAIRDFTRLAGVEGTVLDLFDLQQFRDFHAQCTIPSKSGKPRRCAVCKGTGQPPAGWREATSADIQRAAHGQRPNIVFLSAPCKGFSGLLNAKAAASTRYQALNRLTVRGIRLMLAAWEGDPPELVIFENVPRIRQRGRDLLDDIVHELEMAGYAVAETAHDCGEIGGLAQHRPRFLLVARHKAKVPPFLYEPPKRRVRAVGEVLGEMPMPDDAQAGQMHRSPLLEWRTWVRLALIPAGGDWRSLEGMDFGRYGIERVSWRSGALGVRGWDDPAAVVASRSGPTNTASAAVADPRPGNTADGGKRFNNVFRVIEWGEPSQAVTAGTSPCAGGQAVADPRSETSWEGKSKYRVTRMDEPAGAVIAASSTGNGAYAVADDRPPPGVVERDGHVYGVTGWDAPAEAVTGKGTASGPGSGRFSVADPRVGEDAPVEWGGGGHGVTPWEAPAGTVRADSLPSNGPFAVADPRPLSLGEHSNKMRVEPWDAPAHAVTGSDRVGSGALSVQDPRINLKLGRDFEGGGHYGVVPWEDPANAVTGSGSYDNGFNSVADPRGIPADDDRPDPVPFIISLDGTRHRPFTTLELAALQGFPWRELILTPMSGKGDTHWREHIGNAVPPPTAEAVACVMGHTLLLARAGIRFQLSAAPVWVRRLAWSMSVAAEDEAGAVA